jgi:hypothetical protein
MTVLSLQAMATPTLYADKINSQFHKSQSHYVDLKTRLDESIKSDPWMLSIVNDAIVTFKSKHPSVKQWSDLTFCSAVSTTIDKIQIDTTLQRRLDVVHACDIIDHFRQIAVMPICVYEDPACPGSYVCWDGQHTAMVLFMIASQALNLDITQCQIPIVIYASHQKAEMRNTFILLNGEGKKPLDPIDVFHQKLFGVRTDGSTDANWLLIEKKQQALESAKMFVTHEKFGDIYEPGAYTRLNEILDPDYDLSVTENFCKYFFKMCKSSRPVQPKESWMLYEYFRLCKAAGITVDDAYILNVVNSLKAAYPSGDFDSNHFYNHAKARYQTWWLNSNNSLDGTLRGISYPEIRLGMTLFVEQVAKNFPGSQIKLKNPLWHVTSGDLL